MLFALISLSSAQDIDTLEVAGGHWEGSGALQLAHPVLGEQGSFYGGVGFALADDPLVFIDGNDVETVIVHRQASARLGAGYTVHERVRIDLAVSGYGTSGPDLSGFAMGDIRLGALVRLAGDESLGFAIAPSVDIPTGNDAAYSGGTFGGQLTAAVGGQKERLGWRANVGIDLGGSQPIGEVDRGTSFLAGVGANVGVTESVDLGAEITSSIGLVGQDGWRSNPTEGHLYGQWRHESGLGIGAGAGTAIIGGIGAPDWRVLGTLSFAKPPGPDDSDGDGLIDENDDCPNDPEDEDGFQDGDGCPDEDNDGDGVLDVDDSCPMDPEDVDGFEDADGCPDPDNDGDGFLDVDDQCPLDPGTVEGCPDGDADGTADKDDECPTEAGPLDAYPAGCPDRDADQVADVRDQCPDEPDDDRADPMRSDGCPSKVVVTKEKIEILDKIYFNTGKSTIKPVSYSILEDVAKVLNANQDITKIEVAGHTDSDDTDERNLELSQARGEAVVKHMADRHGVDASRLDPKGYGESMPVVPNDTAENKARNRRVEFVIMEQEGVE
ncbi:MAG: OmpA family protein [Proteobacteria bacterium]|nr:OmpA family protein [Pseudomonadota bacterium]MCP4920942.1 OmpA family protein [Pseudomonadota bacterium]